MNKNRIVNTIKPFTDGFIEFMRDSRGEIDLTTKKADVQGKNIHTKKIGKMNYTVESHFKKNAGCDLVEKFRRLIKI